MELFIIWLAAVVTTAFVKPSAVGLVALSPLLLGLAAIAVFTGVMVLAIIVGVPIMLLMAMFG